MQFDSNGWLDAATEVDYSGNSMSRQGYSIKYLVIHGTAGGTSAQGIAQYFQSTVGGSNPVSSHIIIDQQGNIVQGVPFSLAAFGNGVITTGHAMYLPDPSINPNWYTASIEFVKSSTDNSDVLTDIQQQIGFEVIQCICDTYNIPKRVGDVNGGVIRHADIDPINRSRCPGTFDFDALWAYLNGGDQPMTIDLSNPTVASHFTGADNTMWTCKDNGFVIGNAILDFYRKFGGDGLCGLTYAGLPTSLELPIHGHPGVVQQEFERCALQYDPNHACDFPPGAGPVYVVHTNQDLRTIALQDDITTLQTLPGAKNLLQINALAAQIVKLSAVQ